jgi:RNA polymerase sigma factor (sigma-70 family)
MPEVGNDAANTRELGGAAARPALGSDDALAKAAARDASLAALVQRMGNADQAALGELYDLTVRRVYSLAARIVRDAGLAEEVSEDTFFQAWREAKRYDSSRGRVMTWLLTICRSRALDALRRVDIAECVEDADQFRADETAALADPASLIDGIASDTVVRSAMDQLPSKERQAIALAFFRGLTHQEIADHWQMPLGSVKTLMHRAFGQLRALLGDHMEFAQ